MWCRSVGLRVKPGQSGGTGPRAPSPYLPHFPRLLESASCKCTCCWQSPAPDTSPEKPPQTLNPSSATCMYAWCSHKDGHFISVLRLTFRDPFYILSQEELL